MQGSIPELGLVTRMSSYLIHPTNSGVDRRGEKLAGANDLAHYSCQGISCHHRPRLELQDGKRRLDLRIADSILVVCLHLLHNGRSANDQRATARLLQVARIAERLKARDSKIALRNDDHRSHMNES
jgi:hypothetical protein